jgi:hypothetical protein
MLGASLRKILVAACGLMLGTPAHSESSWLAGNIVNISSGSAGLFIMLSTGVPDNCAGTPYSWMLIPESAKTMIAVTLLARLQNWPVVVYTNGRDATGYCTINQVDPSA